MGPFNQEHAVIRNYLELVLELPWSISSNDTLDLKKARMDLDADHYGMEKLKKRVLEYLAVRQLKNNLRGPILCFVGPPGVGKTSIGRSIAQTLGKRFTRISLGGVYNQADIRGHRRTYVGALPGRIIQAVRNAGVKNPVILLDEIDKMSSGVQGDPGAALLEVLDPEQNCHFVDHYLNVPFDLSQVMFLATANRVTTISPALYDRMEIIYMTGYTQEEKFLITQRHLLPKQLSQHGLDSSLMEIPNESVKLLISSYTREAGVRNLERKLAALCRAVALKVAMNQSAMVDDVITGDNPTNEVNSKVYDGNEIWSRLGVAGVAVGLSVNEAGGNVLLVEANKMAPGTGQLELTGRLGTVIKESAILAYSWLRTVAHQYGLSGEDESTDLLGCTDVHIHFPAGAVGKEGPSAGITIATALISLFAQIPVAPDVALTGEITLRGLVLPVGGIKEKILAAHRAGLKRVIVPKKCDKYLSGIPKDILVSRIIFF
ncbi:hypothetical protein AAG570_008819 [Ranatra chinensis]|uniref:Lon proteolytic domain-containing protein n=1 Tax=Ranatra chinensis TaxID=642074 RepID=A0ABD0Z4W0_9HEMI